MPVQPYPAGTRWRFRARNGYEKTQELALYPEAHSSTITDNYLPEEITPEELWALWTDQMADYAHTQWPGHYRPGEVPISWSVTTPEIAGTFEAAPHTLDRPAHPNLSGFGEVPREDFLTHYTHPVHAKTGKPVNWLRLPVLDFGWNAHESHKGGFIQEVTGWKPSPLQDRMNVRQLAAAAGLYAPPEPSPATPGPAQPAGQS